VAALGVLEEVVWFGAADHSPAELAEWIDEEGGAALGVVAVDGERVLGFASPGRHEALFFADPAHLDAAADVLLPWLGDRRDAFQLMMIGTDTARARAYERHGLSHRHSSFTLVRPADTGPLPDAPFPAGIEVAPYAPGEADEAVHRLIYVDAEWAAVPGHTERDLEAWQTAMAACPRMFIARRDGHPAGWIASRVFDSGRGYVHLLAVATGERGRGLGRALLVHAFADLLREGAHDLSLGVEAQNATALGLYRSAGMEVEQEWQAFGTPDP
jgi:ribosomal protein S18 acetylase RimI-like enzyme